MRLIPLASGSSGNCIYVGTDTTHLLVDVGISAKKVESSVNEIGLDIRDIDGILITHEHSDHIGGLSVLSRKYEIPVYTTAKTKDAIVSSIRKSRSGDIDPDIICEIYPEDKLTIKDMVVNPMRISHDAADPVAYRFKHGDKRAAVVTDLGNFNEYTVESLKGINALLLEANHDINMLQVGPYPYYLKQRILSDRGHLSNERAGALLHEILHDNLEAVVLGHLSKENNIPELAYESVRVELTMRQMQSEEKRIGIEDIPIFVAKRNEVSEIITI